MTSAVQNRIILISSPALLLSNTKLIRPRSPPTPRPKPSRPPRRRPKGPSSVSYFFERTVSPNFQGQITRDISVACSVRGKPCASVIRENKPCVHTYLGRGRNEKDIENGWIGTRMEPTAPNPAPRYAGAPSLPKGVSGAQANGNGGGKRGGMNVRENF
jgi:hypothetical protein